MKRRPYALGIHDTHVRYAYEIGQKYLQDNSKTSFYFFFQTYNYKVYETATDRNFLDPYIYLSSSGEKMENNLSTFLLL